MPDPSEYTCFYLSYSGISLPLKLVSPIDSDGIQNRNTYFAAKHDDNDRLTEVVKFIYGEVALQHRYSYRSDGSLEMAEITDEDDEVQRLVFDSSGRPQLY